MKYHAIEAIPTGQMPLDLPNFHVLIHRAEDGRMIGECLDFGLRAYSQQEDDDTAIDRVFERIKEMAINHIIGHLKRGTVEHLYSNSSALSGKWEVFFREHNQGKIAELQESYREWISDPASRLNSVSLGQIKAALPPEAASELLELLHGITDLPDEHMQEAIQDFLAALVDYRRKSIREISDPSQVA
jgi:hypothetical protein